MKNAAEAVVKSRDLFEEKTDNLPKDIQMVPLSFFSFFLFFITFSLLQAIAQYFKGCIKKKSATESGDPKPVKIKQVYSIRDVIKQNYQDLIQDEIPYNSSDKCYLGSYQRAVTTVQKNMTESDLEEAQKIVNTCGMHKVLLLMLN